MKYDNLVSRIALTALILSSAGCATQLSQPEALPATDVKMLKPEVVKETETENAVVVSTEMKKSKLELTKTILEPDQYLPNQEVQFDETGTPIPYQAAPNPYLGLKGQIKKQSVITFIQARRAYKVNDLKQAEILLAKLVVEDNTLAGPWVIRGDIRLQQNDLDKAAAHFTKAIEVNQFNVNAYLRLAKVQRLKGEFLNAEKTYARALSIWQDFPEAHLNLAVLYDVYLNRPLKALRHMEAYQFLTKGRNQKVADWLAEIIDRTGSGINAGSENTDSNLKPAS